MVLDMQVEALTDASLHALKNVVGLGSIDLGQRLEACSDAHGECPDVDAECYLAATHDLHLASSAALPSPNPIR